MGGWSGMGVITLDEFGESGWLSLKLFALTRHGKAVNARLNSTPMELHLVILGSRVQYLCT